MSGTNAYSAVPVPAPQPGCLVPLVAAGEPEPHLEHQAGTRSIGDRCRPRALPARLERLAHQQGPPVGQTGHDRWQTGDPLAHAFIAARGLGQIPRHSEGRHSKTLTTRRWQRQAI
jgi:hypothetical protein